VHCGIKLSIVGVGYGSLYVQEESLFLTDDPRRFGVDVWSVGDASVFDVACRPRAEKACGCLVFSVVEEEPASSPDPGVAPVTAVLRLLKRAREGEGREACACFGIDSSDDESGRDEKDWGRIDELRSFLRREAEDFPNDPSEPITAVFDVGEREARKGVEGVFSVDCERDFPDHRVAAPAGDVEDKVLDSASRVETPVKGIREVGR